MGAIKTQAKQLKVSETIIRVMKRNNHDTIDQYKEARRERKTVQKDAKQKKASTSRALRGVKNKNKTQPKKK